VSAFLSPVRPEVAFPGETCRNVAARLAATGLDRVPVVDDAKTYRLLGLVSRHDLVKPLLSVFTEEGEREQFRRVWLPGGARFAPVGKPQDAQGVRTEETAESGR
jgi:hypothetical protein